MTEFILHHYPESPFSEKIRIAFGLKSLAWRSVIIPSIMPKPGLIALTGGYRKTPVMQIGADIYCDTQLIMREIERRHPSPSLYAGTDSGVCAALSWSIEKSIFMPAVGIAFGAIGDRIPAAFIEDRQKFSGGHIDIAQMRAARPLLLAQLGAHLGWLAEMLADGRPYLLGTHPTGVDLSAYHPVWFIRNLLGSAAAAIPAVKHLFPWADRIAAIGHGMPSELASTAALEIAHAAQPETPLSHDPEDPSGATPGDRVSVMPDDNGRDPVSGVLVAASAQEIIIAREDPETGAVHVHFPRAGFVVNTA
jgi:glutathione S-transferase